MTPADRAAIGGLLERNGSAVLRELYKRIAADEELARKVVAPLDDIERRQVAHVLGLVGSPEAPDYLARTDRIGRTHVRIGLAAEFYVAGYAAVLAPVVAAIGSLRPWSGRETARLAAAVVQTVLLDMALVLSVYEAGVRAETEARRARLEAAIGEASSMLGEIFADLRARTKDLHASAETLQGEATATDQKCQAASQVVSDSKERLDTSSSANESFTRSIATAGQNATSAASLAREAIQRGAVVRETVSTLTESAEKIGSVVELIGEIAAQTNLLALNATIEAARAGEAGKGFSVVAQEVKQLSNQTAKATGEITAQVNAMQAATNQAAAQIAAIVEAIERVGGGVSEIVESTGAQADAASTVGSEIGRVVHGFAELDETLRATAASAGLTRAAAEKVNGASREIDQRAGQMRETIEAFFAKVG
jgi:methyl-accepting chemotaxis protein